MVGEGLSAGRAAAERLADKWLAGGELRTASSTYSLESPAIPGMQLRVADCGVSDAILAAEFAQKAQEPWASTSMVDRVAAVRRIGEAIRGARGEFIELIVLESGKALRYATLEVDYALVQMDAMCLAATSLHGASVQDLASRREIAVTHRPVGPALLVTPWNFPLSLGLRKAVTALLAGCPFVLKPSDRAPLTSMAMAEAVMVADLPGGTCSVIPTSNSVGVVDTLLAHEAIAKLSFTGSTEVGRALQRRAADGLVRTSLELGGNAPFILGQDTPYADAAPAILAAKFGNSGQACTALNRLYVPDHRLDEVLVHLAASVDALEVGDPMSESTVIGPLITAEAAARVNGLMQRARNAGATVRESVVEVPEGERYVRPAIVSGVETDSEIAQSELFAPVVTVIGYKDTSDAVRQANSTQYGLAAYVASNDAAELESLVHGVKAGMIAVNSGSVSAASSPFGGIGWSGHGRENGSWGLSEFTDVVAVLR